MNSHARACYGGFAHAEADRSTPARPKMQCSTTAMKQAKSAKAARLNCMNELAMVQVRVE